MMVDRKPIGEDESAALDAYENANGPQAWPTEPTRRRRRQAKAKRAAKKVKRKASRK